MVYSQEEIKLILEDTKLKDLYVQLLELKLKTDLKFGNEQLSELNDFNKKEKTIKKVVTPEF